MRLYRRELTQQTSFRRWFSGVARIHMRPDQNKSRFDLD